MLEGTALLARGTIARRLCAPPWRIALERLLSSGEVVAFGQRFVIARRPHRPTAAELAAAGRLEELDAAVLASLDAILTRERRCYVTAGELQVATGFPAITSAGVCCA